MTPFLVAPSATTLPATLPAALPAPTAAPGPSGKNSSFDEERGEILASVRNTLSTSSPDPDQMAACSYLLKHLSETAGRLR